MEKGEPAFWTKRRRTNDPSESQKTTKKFKKDKRIIGVRETIMMKMIKIEQNSRESLGAFSRKITKMIILRILMI